MSSSTPDSPDSNSRLELMNAEIESIESVHNRNFAQIQWMFTTYLAVVATYLSIGGFLGKDLAGQTGIVSSFATSRWIPVIVGLPPTVMVFFLSWLVLSLFAHKIRDHLLLNKQMQKLQRLRSSLLYCETTPPRPPPASGGDEPYVPEFLTFLPVIYFIGNLLLLLSSVIYLLVLSRVNFSAAFAWGLAAVMLVSFFYHKAITAYFKHYDAGRSCHSIEEVKAYERAYERNRKPGRNFRIQLLYTPAKVFLVAVVSYCAVVLTGLDLTPSSDLKLWSLKHRMIWVSDNYQKAVALTNYNGLKWPLVIVCLNLALLTFLLKWRSTAAGNLRARKAAERALGTFRQQNTRDLKKT